MFMLKPPVFVYFSFRLHASEPMLLSLRSLQGASRDVRRKCALALPDARILSFRIDDN